MSLTDEAPTIWERCVKCQRQYRYPHLCRTHMLCGLCHPLMDDDTADRG